MTNVVMADRGVKQTDLEAYLAKVKASVLPETATQKLLGPEFDNYPTLFFKGNPSLLDKKIVSVVGTRSPSPEGIQRTIKVTKQLVKLGFVVMSGLAKGIDTIAHKTTLKENGHTIAVLGTPIHLIYPAENKHLADEIAQKGLLLSSSMPHEAHGRYLFPRRNRLMALISMATIVIEAGPSSGVKHQAAECLRHHKKLIFLRSLVSSTNAAWVHGFVKSGANVVDTPEELKKTLL